jgi:hypothetical protein
MKPAGAKKALTRSAEMVLTVALVVIWPVGLQPR